MSRPLIGIPMSSHTNQMEWARVEFSGVAAYSRALDLNGGAAMFIPLDLGEESLRALYEQTDGILLTGGDDIHPAAYGEEVQPFCGPADALRDATELKLARWALAERKPVLAICRGLQMVNVALGGSLYQDIETQYPDPIQHRQVKNGEPVNAPHPIVIEAGSRLAEALGATGIVVNSGHHQAVKDLADGLRVTARASDRIVEAAEGSDPGAYLLAVQFHPELLIDVEPRIRGIFRDFVKACNLK